MLAMWNKRRGWTLTGADQPVDPYLLAGAQLLATIVAHGRGLSANHVLLFCCVWWLRPARPGPAASHQKKCQNHICTYMHIPGLRFPHARYKARDGHICDCNHIWSNIHVEHVWLSCIHGHTCKHTCVCLDINKCDPIFKYSIKILLFKFYFIIYTYLYI